MDESALEHVRDWLARAGRDLRPARLLAAADDPPPDIAIDHCQQAAEKSIKAWLQGSGSVWKNPVILRNEEPPRRRRGQVGEGGRASRLFSSSGTFLKQKIVRGISLRST